MALCTFVVNSVGDANCMYIKNETNSLMIDCGVEGYKYYNNNLKIRNQLIYLNELLITHYHNDHFNILKHVPKNSLTVSKLYYPYIPKIKERNLLIKEILFVMYLNLMLSGCKAYDLVQLLKEKNAFPDFYYEPLYKGKTIFNDELEVIWPPLNFPDTDQSTLSRKIREIEELIKDIPDLKDLWGNFDRLEINEEKELPEAEICDFYELDEYFIKNLKTDIKPEINNIDSKLRNITNRFSICLYKKGELLSLGDLEKQEVIQCLQQLKNDTNLDRIHVKYFITPHHGSKNHYDPLISSFIDPEYVISSNGKKMMNEYATKYNNLGIYHHCTYENGDFERYCINPFCSVRN